MDDLISRRDAIDAVHRNYDTILDFKSDGRTVADSFEDIVNALPSAQPDLCDGCDRYGASCVGEGCGKLEMSEVAKDTNVPINDTISRQDAIDALDNIKIPRNASWYPYYQQALTAMSRLPSAYPETDSFCTDCKEYDAEKHFCPRFDRVIKTTIEEMGIIHCKDCKHWMPYDWMFSEVWQSKNMNDYPEKEIGCAYCDMNMGANDFCSRAERREK